MSEKTKSHRPDSVGRMRVVIVGGGSAGWMAAAFLARQTDCHVTVVESPSVGPVGVGEATIPSLLAFLQNVGIREETFLRRCRGTYKLGIRFDGWTSPNHSYWHPFGRCGGRINGLDLFHFWFRQRFNGATDQYTDYSPQATMCRTSRAHRRPGEDSQVSNYAFHLDSGDFATLLRDVAAKEGVDHHLSGVNDVRRDQRGFICSVRCEDGREFSGDLFVDCTGSAGLLVEQTLDDPWVDWSSQLLCDRAVVVRKPLEDLPPYTTATAQQAGWVWKIPLTDSTRYGHVYSSAHTSDDEARRTLLSQAETTDDASTRLLKFRVGRRTQFWNKNCVALGLSAAFTEPLESTGIFLIQRGLEELLECLPGDGPQARLARLYNRRMAAACDEVRDFVLTHYLLTGRKEAFWQDSRQVRPSDALQDRLDLYQDCGYLQLADRNPVFQDTNWLCILAGGERYPARPLPRTAHINAAAVGDLMNQLRAKCDQTAREMPSHATLLESIHSRPLLPAAGCSDNNSGGAAGTACAPISGHKVAAAPLRRG